MGKGSPVEEELNFTTKHSPELNFAVHCGETGLITLCRPKNRLKVAWEQREGEDRIVIPRPKT